MVNSVSVFKIKIAWIFKFKFCGNLSISWEFNSNVDRTPINPMLDAEGSTPTNPVTIGGEVFERAKVEELVKGVSMLTNETFNIPFLTSVPTSSVPAAISNTIIPLDTYIDIKSKKGLIPGAVANIIGGVNNPPIRYAENVPPEKIIRGKEVRQVTHEYSIESIEIKSWNPQTNSWQDYHPYKALYPGDPTLDTLKIGQFQKTDGQYSTIRLLATTPFSYTEQGQPGWYIPEQYGITAASLFCEGEHRTKDCSTFLDKPLGQKYHCYDENHLFYAHQVAYFLLNKEDEDFAEVVNEANSFGISQSLRFKNSNTLQIRLPEPSVEVDLKLTTHSQGVKIRYYASLIDDTTSHVTYGNPDVGAPVPTDPYEVYVAAADLSSPVIYNHPEWLPVTRIEVIPQFPNQAAIDLLLEQIASIQHTNNLIALGIEEGESQSTEEQEAKLADLYDIGCALIESEPTGSELPRDCDAKAICELYESLKAIEPCFNVDKVSDWKPITDCAQNVLDLIYAFDKANPACELVKRFGFILEAHILNFIGDPGYDTLPRMISGLTEILEYLKTHGGCKECHRDAELCDIWQRIFDIRNSCLPHPQQVKARRIETYIGCYRDIVTLIESIPDEKLRGAIEKKLGPVHYFIANPKIEFYAAAWEAIQCILDMILEAANCNCDAKERNCHTLFHEVCWLSIEAYQFNINIPGQAAIEADAQATIDGITQYIQPVWRPDTSYYVRFVLKDVVDGDTAGATSYPFVYGFSTAGPVGYFHTHPNSTYGDYQDGATTVQDAQINPDKYALTSIRRYIDYKRSYPNADGNLLSAKPLFYNDETTRIDLFFVKAYTTHFFQNWQAYNGQGAIDGRIKIVIKDPREDSTITNPPYLDYDPADTIHTNIPQTIESWEDDPNPIMPHVFDQYASLFEDNDCVATGGNTIIPKSSYLTIVPKHLKPLKLYTVLVNNLYDLDKDGSFDETDGEIREVHKFNFQTSRYASFKDQVNSYILSDNDPVTPTTREAVFDISKDLTTIEIQAAYDTIMGVANSMSDGLVTDYQHPYDRIVEGILGFKPIDEAISTEFNLVKNSADGDKIVALIIRNPEPFNNPKIPVAEILDTIQVLNNAGSQDTNYKILFSKDYSQAIIMHTSHEITPGLFDFKFQYKIWDGTDYVVPGMPQFTTDEVGTIVIEDLDLQ